MTYTSAEGQLKHRRAECPSRSIFWKTKRSFDFFVSLMALPILAGVALVLTLINPWLNPGPLFFRQTRMGRNGTPFSILKFRSMRPQDGPSRGAADPLEEDRITPLGMLLRRTRIDELPQIINVLRGEMSLIGPRPDCIEHARDFELTAPSYRARHAVRPGISGYAQVSLGYTEGRESAEVKARLDLFYIDNAGWRMEVWILLRTLAVILNGHGAR